MPDMQAGWLSSGVFTAALLFCMGLNGCGNGLPHSSDINMSISPAAATVAVNGTVTLVGSATGVTRDPVIQWWIQESHDVDRLRDCGILTTQLPPSPSSCPFGYVAFPNVDSFPSTAVYHPPATPGTYHVTVEMTQVVTFDSVSKTAMATITVTP